MPSVHKELKFRAYVYDDDNKVVVDHRGIIVTVHSIKDILNALRVRYDYSCVILDNIRLSDDTEESIIIYAN